MTPKLALFLREYRLERKYLYQEFGKTLDLDDIAFATIEDSPLGWGSRRGFHKPYPQVMLPTQVVERVSFGHPELEPNRLFWGGNPHVMRQLLSQSTDLIYIHPPFFSSKQYNVLFGDQNELRSFAGAWEARPDQSVRKQ